MPRTARPLALGTTLLLALPAVVRSQGAPADSLADVAALRRLKEREWPRVYREQDPAGLARILAPEFRVTDAAGAQSDRAGELAHVRGTPPAYDSLVFRATRIDVYDGRYAVVAGTGTIFTSRAGGPSAASTIYASTNVLVKRDGRWQAVASHVSGVRPATRDGASSTPSTRSRRSST
jgi:hypothetical protein